MGEFARLLALEESFEWEGQTYRLAPLDQLEVCGLWEQWLEDRAWAALARQRGKLPPGEYEGLQAALLAGIAAGDYDFLSAASGKAIASWPGRIEIAAVRVFVSLTDAERTDGKRDQLRKMLRKINEEALEKWAEIQARMARQDSDPNSPAPASPTTTPGGSGGSSSAPSSPASPTPTSSPASGAS